MALVIFQEPLVLIGDLEDELQAGYLQRRIVRSETVEEPIGDSSDVKLKYVVIITS